MGSTFLLRYWLQQQQESLNTTKEQVKDIKAQHQAEVQKKTKLELSLRRVEEENFKLLNQVDHLNMFSSFVALLSVKALI